ncbi:MAG: PilC/PilY family type IV pilus protein, partial [Betaproteobacteria bacterium]
MPAYLASFACRRLVGGLARTLVGNIVAILIGHGSTVTMAHAGVALLADEPLRLGALTSSDLANGSCPGLAIESVSLSSSGKYVYRVRFAANWQGSLTKVEIDPRTGNDVTELWRAGDRLSSRLLIVPGVKDTPWLTERRIASRDSTGKAVPFLWENLTLSQQDSLAPGKPARGKAILEFLRGSRANEGTAVDRFRIRAGPLGDISNSRAVFVGAPNAPYLDRNDPGYSTFRNAYASRAGRVYVGANDGMMHAFDDATGDETWAYVPLALYRPDSTGLGALSYQDGALPPFRHHYYVDSTPRIADVDFGGGAWRSL